MSDQTRSYYDWNPIFNKIMEIKDNYLSYKNKMDVSFWEGTGTLMVLSSIYNKFDFDSALNNWVKILNNQEYIDFIAPFHINQLGTLILIKYDMIECAKSTDMWTNHNSIYREARSIVIDLKEEIIVLCPFRKFFNVNEVPENTIDNLTKEIMQASIVEWANKLDCSLQNATWYNGTAILAGSQALDPENSWRVKNGYEKLTENYIEMLRDHEDLTFSFENINSSDKHVVQYTDDQQGLYLIGIRDNTTGYQYSYTECKSIAKTYDILMTEIEDITLKEALKLAKKLKANEKEGWVVYIDGRLVKIKCEDYVQMHRLIGKYTSPNYIVEAVYKDTLDEFLIQAPDIYHEEILQIATLTKKYQDHTNQDINMWYNNAPKDDRKIFMVWCEENVPKEIIGYVRSKYLNQEYNVLEKSKRCKTAKEIGIISGEIE